MGKRKKEKVKLTTMLPVDIYKRIIELAYKLYGSRKGSIAQVICNAINLYYSSRLSAHTEGTKPIPNNPPPHVYSVYIKVKRYVEEKMSIENPYEAPLEYLVEGIVQTRGTDPRTVKKWVNLFLKYGCIRLVSNKVVELK